MMMNDINFLPETVVRHRAAKKRRYSHAVIAAAVAGVLASWWYVEKQTLGSLRELEEHLEQQVGRAQSDLGEAEKLKAERKLLAHQDRIRRELAQPIGHTVVVEMIGAAMPESILMTDLTMVARRAPMLTAAEAKAAKNPTGRGGRVPGKPQAVEEALLVEFSGLAPNDVEIANLVGALSEHTVFTNVKMLYSRSVTTRGVIGREFRMEMLVPLDRDYRPRKSNDVDPAANTQEVADAR